MATWLTADYHLWHQNVLRLTNRPFPTMQRMHEIIVTNYQQRIQDDDEVWFLGDLSLRGPKQIKGVQRIMQQLPGQKHFILGNHDRLKPESYLRMGFLSFHTSVDIQYEGRQYHLVHDPKDALPGTQRLLCGHVHGNWKTRSAPYPTVNVGVDVWDFCPVEITEAIKLMEVT